VARPVRSSPLRRGAPSQLRPRMASVPLFRLSVPLFLFPIVGAVIPIVGAVIPMISILIPSITSASQLA
jgi:hypothetical protein